jgi:hypothetical protein
MTAIGVIEQYWTGVASQLQVEAEVFSRLVGHNGETGRANEIALAQLLERLIPAQYGVGTGILIDRAGRRSRQCDLIIFDKSAQPQILAQSTQLLFPVESVRLVIEVKTTLSSADIEDAAVKVRSVRALECVDGFQVPSFALFAYRAQGAPYSKAREINALSDEDRPEATCILQPGLVSAPNQRGRVGMVPMHETDAGGQRISGSWVIPQQKGAWINVSSIRYPVSRFKGSGSRYVFEPGRALLNFAECILNELDRSGEGGKSWFGHYLPDLAREVVLPS